MTFKELDLLEPILNALEIKGYSTPTPIQQQAIPIILSGSDIMGCAQTGTGKTAAFAIPILQNLYKTQKNEGRRKIRSLILTPTRELAIQIEENIKDYGSNLNLRHAVIFGGVNQTSQINRLKSGIDILVATPGRLLDLQQQGYIDLRSLDSGQKTNLVFFRHDAQGNKNTCQYDTNKSKTSCSYTSLIHR
jgi:ATP-dependent RNA helicase RhlE